MQRTWPCQTCGVRSRLRGQRSALASFLLLAVLGWLLFKLVLGAVVFLAWLVAAVVVAAALLWFALAAR